MAFKFRTQHFEPLRKTHSELYETINKAFPELDVEVKGRIAGIAIESALKGELIFQGTEYEEEENFENFD